MFGEKQLADLTSAVGLMNAYNRVAISFRATPMALARMARVQREAVQAGSFARPI